MVQNVAAADEREARLHAVLGAYLEASDAGWAPPCANFLDGYPDLAPELRDFFSMQAQVAELAAPTPGALPVDFERSTMAMSAQVRGQASDDALTAVGEYESLKKISKGGQGIVFKAWQTGAKRWVALKKILPGPTASLADVQRFRDEAEAVANLDHPHIVPIYYVGEHQGMPYFTMKLFEHGSLNDHLARFTADQRKTAQLAATIARAVHYAHQRGILHRDLKPANILLDDQEQPHVADFGLAKRLEPSASVVVRADGLADSSPNPTAMAAPSLSARTLHAETPATESIEALSYLAPEQASPKGDATVTLEAAAPDTAPTELLAGTPPYMAPEQTAMKKGQVLSTAADVYGLGAILYKVLTGKPPFRGATVADIIEQVRTSAPKPPRRRSIRR